MSDPGATPGTTKFLREDGSFQVPAGSGTGFPASTTTYLVQDAVDNTKQQLWNLASSTTGTNLTLAKMRTSYIVKSDAGERVVYGYCLTITYKYKQEDAP